MLNYAKVKFYNEAKGFGFINLSMLSSLGDRGIFFHIRKVKRFENLLKSLDTSPGKELHFWYSTEKSAKGLSVSNMWVDLEDIPQGIRTDCDDFIEKTTQAIASKVVKELALVEKRRAAIAEKEEFREKFEAQKNELQQLISDVEELNFSTSGQLSNYIISNKVGHKYPTLTGILTMHGANDSWNFNGGIDPTFYRQVCEELDLTNQNSRARAGKFVSYKDSQGS